MIHHDTVTIGEPPYHDTIAIKGDTARFIMILSLLENPYHDTIAITGDTA